VLVGSERLRQRELLGRVRAFAAALYLREVVRVERSCWEETQRF
jgi:hypothetical protein